MRRSIGWMTLLCACGFDPRTAANGDTQTSLTADDGSDGTADGSGSDEGEPGAFGPETEYELRLTEDTPPPLVLQMNRDEVAELFGDAAGDVLLLELDSTPLLVNTLDQVKNACGTAWQIDSPDPNHNCSLTPLGQTFAGPDGTWQTSAEYSMVRIMTMTPANVVVEGTSSQGVEGLANFLSNLGIIDDYSQILSDALGIPRTASIVSTAGLVHTFKYDFLASHPAVPDDGTLSFTLEDALNDLATMTDRYGPVGTHPGILDPSFPVHGEVLGPDFKMIANAESNLRLVDGVDANRGKGFLSVVVDTIGPSFEDELEFDFTDPERFRIEGLVDDLVVDMRFRMTEFPGFVPSCTGTACQDNLPGAPHDNLSVWAKQPWLSEYAVTAGAYQDYQNRVHSEDYLLGSCSVDIGQDGDPAGWVRYFLLIELVNPPEDQYIWETVLEVAQVALHHTDFATFPEGGADVGFTVEDIPVGISGSEAAEAVRPYLQEQNSALSDILLGNYEENNDIVDFFYRRAENGEGYAYFAAPVDRAEGVPYGYDTVGFFADAGLSDKISSLEIDGVSDVAHEKVALPVGETVVYFADELGDVYRARFVVEGDGSEITVAIAQKVDA